MATTKTRRPKAAAKRTLQAHVSISVGTFTRLIAQVGKLSKQQEQFSKEQGEMSARLERLNLNGSAAALHKLADHADVLVDTAIALQREREAKDYERQQFERQAENRREYERAHPFRTKLRTNLGKAFWILLAAGGSGVAGYLAHR